MRFFIVFFTSIVYGLPKQYESSITTEDGSYLKRSEFIDLCEAQGHHSVVITNILEVNESDFTDYNS